MTDIDILTELGCFGSTAPLANSFVWASNSVPIVGVTKTINKTDSAGVRTITLTPTLGAISGSPTNVALYVRGGHSDIEDVGIGKNYTLACAATGAVITQTGVNETLLSVAIPAGDTTVTATLTVVNNVILEMDRNLAISAAGFGSKTLTIHDDNIPETDGYANIIDVTAPNKVWNDHATTARNIASVSALSATPDYNNTTDFGRITTWLNDNGGGIMYFPDGTYDMFNADVAMDATASSKGITLWGQTTAGTILRKYLPTADLSAAICYRQLMIPNQYYNTSGNSAPVSLINFTFDGHGQPQGYQLAAASAVSDGEGFHLRFQAVSGTDYHQYYLFLDTPTGAGAGTYTDPWQVQNSGTMATLSTSLMSAMSDPAKGNLDCRRIDATNFNAFLNSTDYYPWNGDVTLESTGTAWEIGGIPVVTACGNPGSPSKITFYNMELAYDFETAPVYISTGQVTVVNLENILLVNTPNSTGINIGANTIVKMFNVSDDGSYFGRGAVTFDSANTIGYIDTMDVGGLHFEITGGGDAGAGAIYTTKFYLTNITCNGFLYDPCKTGFNAASEFTASNLTVAEAYQIVPGSQAAGNFTNPITFTDCSFTTTSIRDALQYPMDITFTRCKFYGNALHAYDRSYALPISGVDSTAYLNTVTLSDCDFYLLAGATGTYKMGVGLQTTVANYTGGGGYVSPLKVIISDSRFNSAFTRCFGPSGAALGGWWVVSGNTYGTASVHPTYVGSWVGRGDTKCRFDITGGDETIYTTKYMYFNGDYIANGGSFNASGVALTATQNVIDWNSGDIDWATLTTYITFSGAAGVIRTITGTTAPVDGTTKGFKGASDADHYINTTPDPDDVYNCSDMGNLLWTKE